MDQLAAQAVVQVVGQAQALLQARVGEFLGLELGPQMLGFFLLCDVEGEADQRCGLALFVAQHMHDFLDPDKAVVAGQRTVLGLVIHASQAKLHAARDGLLALVGVDAFGPVVHGLPALGTPAQQISDLRADIAVFLRGPVNLEGNRQGGFQQRLVEAVVRVGFKGTQAGAGFKHGTLLSDREEGGWWAARSRTSRNSRPRSAAGSGF
ncbi:hypothetical protein SDC9_160879 [bioreactor metagenome]|uniref:Uncharacterized protein n=1 Tax=bioreactor metagenome TaxID=1076179 RepID=A0A645FGN5_9ZZZZ